jgi:hypothetical protein
VKQPDASILQTETGCPQGPENSSRPAGSKRLRQALVRVLPLAALTGAVGVASGYGIFFLVWDEMPHERHFSFVIGIGVAALLSGFIELIRNCIARLI